MDTFFHIFVGRVWALVADQLNALSRLGRRVLTRDCQIGNYARRSRNHIHTLAFIRTKTNKPITFVEEPLPAAREACKRLHTGEFADETKRLAYQESIAQDFNDLSVDYDDKINIIEASNGGNLYGGNGTTGHIISNDDELYVHNARIGVTASNGGNLYGGNGTKGNKMVCDNEPIGINNDEISKANNARNVNYNTTDMANENDDIYVIDVDAMSICGASNGGNDTTGNKIISNDELYEANNETNNNNGSYENIAAVFDNID